MQTRYVNFVYERGAKEPVMHTAPLADGDRAYLLAAIAPNLRSLSDAEYLDGPAILSQATAPSSYTLHGADVYWCVEWDPGLIVVRFSPDGRMAWTALRSPVPHFGGREPGPDDDVEGYDEDADNPQYNLVFRPWDAQFDADHRRWGGFVPAEENVTRAFSAALAHAEALGVRRSAELDAAGNDAAAAAIQRCQENLSAWAGDGIRVQR